MSPDNRDESLVITVNAEAAVVEPLILHNEGNSTSIGNSSMGSTVPNDTSNCNIEETHTSLTRCTSLIPSEHSSGSDAAFYCSVGSASEEDTTSASLFHVSEEEHVLTSTPVRGPISAPASGSGIVSYNVVKEKGREEKKGVDEKSRNRLGVLRRFFKRLFSRKESKDNSQGEGGMVSSMMD